MSELLRSGADKVAVNTAMIHRPELISEMTSLWFSMCRFVDRSKRKEENKWEVYTDNGREKTGLCLDEAHAVKLGAGEILLTSSLRRTRKGFDIELVKQVVSMVNVPLITVVEWDVNHMVQVVQGVC